MKKKYPTFLDETCELCDRIAVSAGQRGVQMLLRPRTLRAMSRRKSATSRNSALCLENGGRLRYNEESNRKKWGRDMGLIKAAGGAVGGVLADQWKEYIYCESMAPDVLVCKGRKRVSQRSSNTKGEPDISSRGTVIAVNEGQCMAVVDQGKVVEFCAEPGEFTYDGSPEPSIFCGSLGESIKETFRQIGRRFSFGGGAARDQRVYYFNLKEIVGNKYGTANPVPFRVVDKNIGLDIDIAIRCYGEYSYKIVDPLLFYANVCGNVGSDYRRAQIDGTAQVRADDRAAAGLCAHLGPGRALQRPAPATPWRSPRPSTRSSPRSGPSCAASRSPPLASTPSPPPRADEEMIKDLQRRAVMRDPNMQARRSSRRRPRP